MSDAVSPLPYNPTLSADLPAPPAERRLRLWPGLVLVALQAAALFVPAWVVPGTIAQFWIRFMAPLVVAPAVALWWLFASRLRWAERFLVLGTCVAAGVAALFLCHPSFQFGLALYVLPLLTSGWVLWLLATPFLGWPARRLGLVAGFLLAWGGATLVRMDGVTGSFSPEIAWRWSETAEQRFLAEHGRMTTGETAGAEVVKEGPGDWPGFRGPNRDGRLTGVRIATDWAAHPPRPPVWRHRVGPGWSSFAVVGHRLYTQEQRDKAEAVVCYNAENGAELWAHEDETRFAETVSGAGPRATPTFHDGKVYALGANGRLNCLDAATGAVVWQCDAARDSGAALPPWGFASSPLVFHGLVTVFTGGPDGKSVSAYDAAAGGAPVWMKGEGTHGYSSPQAAHLAGEEVILIASNVGVAALHPTRGDILWHHDWPMDAGLPRCVQPALVGDADVLLAAGMGSGERRLHVTHQGDSWSDETVWTSRALNAYFNDRVVHKGHVYGFDGNMFTCVSLDGNGRARWRGGRYGNGQVLLLADQDLLLVLTEKGEVVLVAADPDRHRELGRFAAIEGKTWNHPVVAHGKLFVRNGEEAACYELPSE